MGPPRREDADMPRAGGLRRLTLPAPVAGLLRSDFARKVAETFGTRVLLIALNGVNTILIARLLGPDGRGQYAVAIAVSVIAAQVLSLGLQSANTYFVARDGSLLARLTSNTIALAASVAAIVAVGFGLFALLPAASPVPLPLMALGLAAVPPMLLVLNLRHLLLGIGEVRAYNSVDLISGMAGVAMTLALAVTGAATPASLLGVVVLIVLIGLGVATRSLRPHVGRLPRPSGELLRRCVPYGFRVYLATGFGLLVLKSDLLVIQYVDGAEATGLYSVASSIADMLWILPSVVGAILFPRLAAISESRERWRLTLRTTAGTMALFVPMLAAVALVAPIAIRILFGADFEAAAGPLRILCAAILFYGATSIFSQFLAARGYPWIVVWIWIAGFFLNLGLTLFMVPSLGIDGAALASLISYAAVFCGIFAVSVRAAGEDAKAAPDTTP
ncbi:MAG: polysaccharide biosynthesis C-terminal domain-containing protein [Actinomycetota bacterium]|nr:polysaccharide biosynthesis C-terminal domain-containing protein [Actinomycetota bacterium]